MIDVVAKVEEAKKKKQRLYPCRSNRASQLGHPCERYLVYMRTRWEEQSLPSIELEFIWEGGRMIEKMALQQLEEAGLEPSNQGRDFEDKNFGITGHIDCYISANGNKYPMEIKGTSPFQFDKIDSVEDMIHSKKVWVRSYPAQLQLYLYLANKEIGLFYILNKLTYKPKAIWMQLDYEFCDGLLKKAKRINEHIVNKTLPDRITDFDVCMDCSFRHICLPDLKALEGVTIIDNQELEDKLDRYHELKALMVESNQIDSYLKTTLEGKNNLSIGKWFISGKYITKHLSAQPAKELRYWQRKIVQI